MIDYHCHLLPGLDDGPETIEESLEMARQLVAFGFVEVCCTPHCIKNHYETSPVVVRDTVRRLQNRLDAEGIPLLLRPGMEYYLDEFFEQFAANLLPLSDSRLVLCEAPPQGHPALVAEMAGLIVVQGFIPLVAHPERSDVIWDLLENRGGDAENRELEGESRGDAEPATTKSSRPFWQRLIPSRFIARPQLRGANPQSPASGAHELPDTCLFQANVGAFAGFYGAKPQRRAYELLQRGVYSCLASDLHDARSAAQFLDIACERLAFNPALQKLGNFVAPKGETGERQLGFW